MMWCCAGLDDVDVLKTASQKGKKPPCLERGDRKAKGCRRVTRPCQQTGREFWVSGHASHTRPSGSALQPVPAAKQRPAPQEQPHGQGGGNYQADRDRAVGVADEAVAEAVDQIEERVEVA